MHVISNTVQKMYTYGAETYCDIKYCTAGVHLWQRLTAKSNTVHMVYTYGTETYCDVK